MDCLVDFNKLEEYKKELDKNIEIINEELAKMYKAQGETVWEGSAYAIASERLYSKLETLSNMIKLLSVISEFLETAHNNYRDGLEEIKKTFEEVLEKIRAEKAKRGIEWDNI